MKSYLLTCVLFAILASLSACQTEAPLVEPTPAFFTATLPPTLPPPTPTLQTATPPAPLILGLTTARLNVRPEPGALGEPLGLLENSVEVEVLGRDAGGDWYQIVYPAAPNGKGWVNAAYIRLADDVAVPVIGVEDEGVPRATVKETLNVRSRPESGSASLGILQPQTAVTLTGRNSDGAWLQIEYPAGSDERGWIASTYVEAPNLESLPLLADDGMLIGTPTPPLPSPVPTFTLLPAPQDGDTLQSPAAQVTFSPSGARQFNFTGQVSAPQGDLEDWVAFTPYAVSGLQVSMHFRLECSGRGELAVRLLEGGVPLENFPVLTCGGQQRSFPLKAGQVYHLLFQVAGSPSELQSVGYIIAIQNGP